MSMKARSFGSRIPNHDEFQAVMAEEFDFLCNDLGFRKSLSPSNPFEASYARGNCRITILGGGYGSFSWMEVHVDERCVPYHLLKQPKSDSQFEASDCSQLDDLRNLSLGLLRDFQELLVEPLHFAQRAWQAERDEADAAQKRRDADPKGTFFSVADPLWKNKKWPEFIAHMNASSYKLGAVWSTRLQETRASSSSSPPPPPTGAPWWRRIIGL